MMNQAVRVLKILKDYYFDPMSITDDYRDKPVEAYEAEEIV